MIAEPGFQRARREEIATETREIEQELLRCVRCGACMGSCPVYAQMHHEGGVARGKLMLIQAAMRDGARLGEGEKRYLEACLLCGACTQSCPNRVDTPAVVRAAREILVTAGVSGGLTHFALRRMLPSPRGLAALLKIARSARALWARRIPASSGLHLRFVHDLAGRPRWIPEIARRFALEMGFSTRFSGHGVKVALFTGCVNNYLRPSVIEASVRALGKLGAAVIVPKNQACCGLPSLSSGERGAAVALARRNLEAFFPGDSPWPEHIVTPCGSCAYLLRKHLPRLLADDPERAERARAFGERVLTFSQFWAKGSPGQVSGQPAQGPILTYHDPCHLSRGLEEMATPRKLLNSLSAARFVEMASADRCCGFGGTFHLSRADLSKGIADIKVASILASGASGVVTECSGCNLWLSEQLAEVAPGIQVLTTVEALERYSPGGSNTSK